MFFVAFAVLMSMQCLYGCDSNTSNAECGGMNHRTINKGLLDLITKNNVTGKEYHPDGRNLAQIEAYLVQHKDAVNFDFIARPYGFHAETTALTLACYQASCSEQVVQLLCDYGANPNKKGSQTCYSGTHCIHQLVDALEGNTTGVIERQRKKFTILKAAAIKNGQKLFLTETWVVKQFRANEDEKEFLADTQYVN